MNHVLPAPVGTFPAPCVTIRPAPALPRLVGTPSIPRSAVGVAPALPAPVGTPPAPFADVQLAPVLFRTVRGAPAPRAAVKIAPALSAPVETPPGLVPTFDRLLRFVGQ